MKLIDRIFRSLYWRMGFRKINTSVEAVQGRLDYLLFNMWNQGEDHVFERDVISSDGLPVVFIADAAYLEPTLVAIYSLLHSAIPGTHYRVFFILTECRPGDRSYVSGLFPGIEIITTEVPQMNYDVETPLSNTALTKFDIDKLVPPEIDQVLYLDGDTIIRQDLTELITMDLKGAPLGACQDLLAYKNAAEGRAYGMKHPERYFNSGVMLMNLAQMRKEGSREKLWNLFDTIKPLGCLDQNYFNLLFEDRVTYLPQKYNIQVTFYEFMEVYGEELAAVVGETKFQLDYHFRNPVIMHYLSPAKPWKYGSVRNFSDGWWFEEKYLLDKLKAKRRLAGHIN